MVTPVSDRVDCTDRDRFEVVFEVIDVGFVGSFSVYGYCNKYRFL